MVFVLGACVISPVSWAESQQQEIELQSKSEPESFEDDPLITGPLPGLIINKYLALLPLLPETLSLTGSDAYPSIALHGPPVTVHPA